MYFYEGNSLPKRTIIPTPSGWKFVEELRVGDEVFGSDGLPYPVIGVTGGIHRSDLARIVLSDSRLIDLPFGSMWPVWPDDPNKKYTMMELREINHLLDPDTHVRIMDNFVVKHPERSRAKDEIEREMYYAKKQQMSVSRDVAGCIKYGPPEIKLEWLTTFMHKDGDDYVIVSRNESLRDQIIDMIYAMGMRPDLNGYPDEDAFQKFNVDSDRADHREEGPMRMVRFNSRKKKDPLCICSTYCAPKENIDDWDCIAIIVGSPDHMFLTTHYVPIHDATLEDRD